MKTTAYTMTLILAGTLGISGASFASHPSVNSNMGTPIHDDSAYRTIVIDSNTRWVNVMEDQRVEFVVNTAKGKQRFSWQFDTTHSTFDLSKVAPAGILDNRTITAYVEPDPDGYAWLMR